MRKSIYFLASVAMLFTAVTPSQAFSLNDLLESEEVKEVVTAVTGGSTVTATSISGTWNYVEPAAELTSDNVLKSAAATTVNAKIVAYMDTAFTKVGIKAGAFTFVFGSDMSFTCNLTSRTLSGTYAIDSSASTVALTFEAVGTLDLGTMNASTVLSGDSLSLMFPADKLLDFISKLSSVSDNDTLSLISSLADEYDGVKLGFNLSR